MKMWYNEDRYKEAIHWSGNSGKTILPRHTRAGKISHNIKTLFICLFFSYIRNWQDRQYCRNDYVVRFDYINVYPMVWYTLRGIIENKWR
jgi:hypothetical protein